jgi:membrane-associated protease RseP (regulator of RpoE activity)
MRKSFTALLVPVLFILTFFTTTVAGVGWLNKDMTDLANFKYGLPYSIILLLFLLAHEFGHYFAARYHKIRTTLPYFIPAPPMFVNPFGTLGAVIRIQSPLYSKKSIFDVGISGPISGLIVAFTLLIIGIITLPGKEYLFTIHPDYRNLETLPTTGFSFGNSLLFWGISQLSSSQGYMPPMNEIYHYPFLCVGWFGLLVTALNLIPVGQLDGGHILYALVGHKLHKKIAKYFFVFLVALGVTSLFPFIGPKYFLSTAGWLLWAAILFFVVKLEHPDIPDETPLSQGRQILGWLMLILFLLLFTPVPFTDDTILH